MRPTPSLFLDFVDDIGNTKFQSTVRSATNRILQPEPEKVQFHDPDQWNNLAADPQHSDLVKRLATEIREKICQM